MAVVDGTNAKLLRNPRNFNPASDPRTVRQLEKPEFKKAPPVGIYEELDYLGELPEPKDTYTKIEKPELKKPPVVGIYENLDYPKSSGIANSLGQKTAEQPKLIQHCAATVPMITSEGKLVELDGTQVYSMTLVPMITSEGKLVELPGPGGCVDIAEGFE